MAESKAQFRARVRALTGIAYRAIPMAPAGHVISSVILARRGQVYVVAAPSAYIPGADWSAGDETSTAALAACGGEFGTGEFTPVLRRCVL